MTDMSFDPGRVLGDEIKNMGRREICELVSRLCSQINAEAGTRSFRGGVYPDNINVSEDGSVSIGLGKDRDWDGQELEFIAPELCWNGSRSQAADVYSLGLLLYSGVSGKLPFEGECENPQLRRMGGEDIKAPAAAGRRLGEIIEKATRFKAEERYQSASELKIMLDSCVKNLYLDGAPSARTLFNKSDEELTDIERMMIGIVAQEDGEPAQEEPAAEAPQESAAGPAAEEEAETVSAGETVMAEEAPQEEDAFSEEEAAPAESADSGEEPAPAEQPEPEQEAVPETRATEAKISEADIEDTVAAVLAAVGGGELAEKPGVKAPKAETVEKVRVYEPGKTKAEKGKPDRQPIPILTEEKNPELAPVVLRKTITPAVQYGKSAERERKIAEQRKKRRRPVVGVLIVCALIIVAAIVANAMLKDFAWGSDRDPQGTAGVQTGTEPTLEPGGAGVVIIPTAPVETQEPEQEEPKESTYQLYVEDVSWTEARERCAERGGHLVVISSMEELNRVAALAEEAGISRIWIGCHRENGSLVWENSEEVLFYAWDVGEPSYEDSYDGAAEDYIMLWNHDGWVYNDSRNDPAAEYPEWYSGTIGYVCEFEG